MYVDHQQQTRRMLAVGLVHARELRRWIIVYARKCIINCAVHQSRSNCAYLHQNLHFHHRPVCLLVARTL